eukprot:TRINITY_DN19439_c0_g1::TRINITY_DN19439_c0_g1_i1::g.17140::m.17140 TRINITY_DN19439_c0_g1::TRINITY_DN19439_c0_g1_i1::g.17140  ORF type:complete len:112 (-),score=20.16,sp/O65154/KIWI_ARATH/58.46/9e-20,PC4/PF02229.11/2.6e+03,PC4/PF02229.11/1.1e-25 TRINITY_DN19439_c0_g1_i1:315-626(-)
MSDKEGDSPEVSDAETKPTEKKETKAQGGHAKQNAEGDTYFDLAKSRRVTVRSFKGKPLIDIREYYEKDGKTLPGKKGISLSPDQWKMLKTMIPDIDIALKSL